MHTPAAAIAWELWRRHRPRIIGVICCVVGFVLFYPRICTLTGFNPAGADPLGDIAKLPLQGEDAITPRLISKILLLLFLAGGPCLGMVVSLLCVTWMFNFIEMDPKTKALAFPGRLFTLPVSTPFLAWPLMLSGLVAVILLHSCWVYLVPMPHVEIFETYQSCLGWMTLLALSQGIAWSLDGWPITRMVLWSVLFFCILGSPAQRGIFEFPLVLPSLFILGVVLARVGLQKIRHGQWQSWNWRWPFAAWPARTALRGPKQFASPAQAQLWFEWRRFARPLCLYAIGLVLAPVVILLVTRLFAGVPLHDDDLSVFVCCLIGVPAFLHFCFSISPRRPDLPFLLNRPLTNAEIMMPTLKAAAISTSICWGLVLAALCAAPLLGDFRGVVQGTSLPLAGWFVIAPGLIFLTWRLIPVNLGFVLSGNRRLVGAPVWILLALYFGGMAMAVLSSDEEFWNAFCRLIPGLLAGLLALKFLLAFVAFRLSLKRRLLSRSMLAGYLAVWVLLVAVLLTLLAVMISHSPPEKFAILPLILGIILLVPLARIGFCPIALSWNRHG